MDDQANPYEAPQAPILRKKDFRWYNVTLVLLAWYRHLVWGTVLGVGGIVVFGFVIHRCVTDDWVTNEPATLLIVGLGISAILLSWSAVYFYQLFKVVRLAWNSRGRRLHLR